MAFLTTGGSQVNSANIVDDAILNADINASAAIALSKLSGLIGNPGSFISIESTIGTTHSLTTVANQKVFVIAITNTNFGSVQQTVTLAYNGVTKHDHIDQGASGADHTVVLAYEEIPGAATADITLTASGALHETRIFVVKLMVG